MERGMSVSKLHRKTQWDDTGLTAMEGGYQILYLEQSGHETFITCFYLVSQT